MNLILLAISLLIAAIIIFALFQEYSDYRKYMRLHPRIVESKTIGLGETIFLSLKNDDSEGDDGDKDEIINFSKWIAN